MSGSGTVAETHKHPNYLAVFWWLFAFTVIEVTLGWFATSFSRGLRPLYIAILIVLAGVKAALVAAYFMHLRFEKLTLTFIALFPIILLVILTIALFPDAASFIPEKK